MAAPIVFYDGPFVTRAFARANGLRKYFTGIVCRNGHIAERYTKGSRCLGCCYFCIRSEAQKAWQARYRRTEARQDANKRRSALPSYKAVAAAYRQTEAYKKRHREQAMRQRGGPKSRKSGISAKWTPGTPEYKENCRIRNHARRIRKRGDLNEFTKSDLEKIRSKETRCHLCGKRFTKNNPATLEHVMPLSRGGKHTISNIALAHKGCNSQKHNSRTHLI